MDALHNNWLNAQASRRYPLDDNATGTGDDATRLKDDVIVDMHLRWPKLAGAYAFLGGVTVTKTIVTAVIMAADSPDAAGGFTPLAAVTVAQPVTEYAYYNLEPLYPGVGGFIAFGDTGEAFNIRFSTPGQGLISPKVGRPYTELPIPTMRKFGRVDGLTGLVKITAGPDIEVVKEEVDIAGTRMDALVIRLLGPTSTRNPLADYIGPCGKRPESKNCDRPGIQTINGVSPDCDGNIDIEFVSMLEAPYRDCGSDAAGVTLDQSLGLPDVCPVRDPGRFRGNDYCEQEIDSSLSLSLSSESAGSTPSSDSTGGGGSSEATPCEDLPFMECFDTGELHPSWVLKFGAYAFVAADSPAEGCLASIPCVDRTSGSSASSQSWSSVSSHFCDVETDLALSLTDVSRRNVMVWENCGVGLSADKKITTQVQLTNQAAQQNAGIVINHRVVSQLTNPQTKYFLASINRNTNRVDLLSYNGSIFITENSVAPATPFSLVDWYEIEVTVTAEPADQHLIAVRVRNITTPSWPQVSFQLLTSRLGQPDGYHGVFANQAVSYFSYWRLEDA